MLFNEFVQSIVMATPPQQQDVHFYIDVRKSLEFQGFIRVSCGVLRGGPGSPVLRVFVGLSPAAVGVHVCWKPVWRPKTLSHSTRDALTRSVSVPWIRP